jgi:hypothetical protein
VVRQRRGRAGYGEDGAGPGGAGGGRAAQDRVDGTGPGSDSMRLVAVAVGQC